jgi:hypothetical protein
MLVVLPTRRRRRFNPGAERDRCSLTIRPNGGGFNPGAREEHGIE